MSPTLDNFKESFLDTEVFLVHLNMIDKKVVKFENLCPLIRQGIYTMLINGKILKQSEPICLKRKTILNCNGNFKKIYNPDDIAIKYDYDVGILL